MIKYFLLLTLFVLSGTLPAAETDPLYQIELEVKDQTYKERTAAMHRAFDWVVLRLTGDAAALHVPSIRQARRKASQWVARFSYLAAVKKENTGTPDEPVHERLLIRFDNAVMDQLITDAGFKLWPTKRLETLMTYELVGFEAMGFEEDSFFMQEQRQQWQERLQHMGDMHALPTRFVEYNDLMTLANGRSVLQGQLTLTREGQWQTRWQHFLDGAETQLFLDGSAEEIVQQLAILLMARLRDHYFSYRVVLQEDSVTIAIYGVQTLAQLQALQSLFASIEDIQARRMVSVDADKAVFALTVKGGQSQLVRDLSQQTSMQRLLMVETLQAEMDAGSLSDSESEEAPVMEKPHPLAYQWQP